MYKKKEKENSRACNFQWSNRHVTYLVLQRDSVVYTGVLCCEEYIVSSSASSSLLWALGVKFYSLARRIKKKKITIKKIEREEIEVYLQKHSKLYFISDLRVFYCGVMNEKNKTRLQ